MKTFFVLVAIALMAHSTKQQNCPEVPGVKSPINYLHLFKSQADTDFNFFDESTTASLVYELETDIVIGTAAGKKLQTVLKVVVDQQPQRTFYYFVEANFNANGSLNEIVKFTRIRDKDDATVDTDMEAYALAFFNTPAANQPVTFAPIDCCLLKLEYINFYYLYSNYYNEGRGKSLTC